MNQRLLKKIGAVIFIMIILRLIIIICLNYVNVHSSHYIEIQNGQILIQEELNDYLYYIDHKRIDDAESKVFYIKSPNKEEFHVLINNLTYPHEIYKNDELVSQNIDENYSHYNSDYSYKVLKIDTCDYIDGTAKISIKGSGVDKTDIFLANDYILNDSREIRTIICVVFLVFLVISTLISLVLYCYNHKDYYFLILSLMGIVSIIKTIVLGELFIFPRLLGITVYNYSFINNLTSIINTILPTLIICYLFDFKIKIKHISIGLIVFLFLSLVIIMSGRPFLNMYNAMFIFIFIAANAIIILAYMKDKPYSRIIMINGVIYSTCTIYYLMVLNGILSNGSLLFFINPPYLGVVFYMGGFLITILLKHLDKVRTLENNKKEYEQILLMRGISHDLKLPLSVIKLNNQMIEKYQLDSDEIKEYANASLDAALELEEMIGNINCFLSLKHINNVGDITSVKECFEKMRSYYSSYNKYDNFRFIVECDDEDCRLNINPLHFSRMLNNLVDNALKYNKDDVLIKASYKINKNLIIIVEDNGLGMEKAEIDRIFQPFYRIDPSRNTGGLGLGLSVVKRVVDSLNGTLEIQSQKGVGTKVVITFPI